MRVETRQVYIAADGQTFGSTEACQEHEQREGEKLKRAHALVVWCIEYGFDKKAGAHCARTYLLVEQTVSLPVILQYCIDRYGEPIQPWRNDSYFEAWRMEKTNLPPQHVFDVHKTLRSRTLRKIDGLSTDVVFLSSHDLDHPDIPTRSYPWPKKR